MTQIRSFLHFKQSFYIVPDNAKSDYLYYRPLGDGVAYDSIRIAYDGLSGELKVEGSTTLTYAFIIQTAVKPTKVLNSDQWKYDSRKKELWMIKTGDRFTINVKN